jgi:DNA-binding transcriptional LysR family regulator
VELRWLTSFVAVAEDLHFAKAADRLHLAPSALSAQVKALESHLGVRLIDRGRRARPALTSAGQAFLVEAQRTLAQAARAEAVGRQASRGELGHAAIAYVASAAFSGVMTSVLADCGSDLVVTVRELETPAQLEALACGDIDIGFLRWRPGYPPGVTAARWPRTRRCRAPRCGTSASSHRTSTRSTTSATTSTRWVTTEASSRSWRPR